MLNIFKQTKPWMVASLLAATSAFAQQQSTPDKSCRTPKAAEPMQAPATAAYNAPSRIDVRGSWDIYLQGSFIYWLPEQDNMEYALSSSSTGIVNGATNSVSTLKPDFKPGFQIQGGMTFEYDNWDSYVQYTWFHNTNSSNASAPLNGNLYPSRGFPSDTNNASAYSKAHESWNLKMDLADWVLSRPYYMSPKMTCRPMWGIRGAWIRQDLDTTYTSNTNVEVYAEKITSWGVGPEVGLTGNYTFGYGLRVFGDASADVLFTRYNTSANETNTTDSSKYSVSEDSLNTIRPHAMLDLGFAWSSYFDNNNWHVDLMASYGFQVFWNQNMFRNAVNSTGTHQTLPNGDLTIQGLNLSARFDF